MSEKLILWNESFSVGNDEMNKQHKKLIDIINKFYNAFKQGKAGEISIEILDEMINYSIIHLISEEKFLKSIEYLYLEEHISSHDEYRKKIVEFRHKIRNKKPEVYYEIFNYLKDWWTNHILNEDMKYSDLSDIE